MRGAGVLGKRDLRATLHTMLKVLPVVLLMAVAAFAQNAPDGDEWEPFRKTGLFAMNSPLWISPDMKKETLGDFSSRLLAGAREGDAKAMATLGRYFYVRGDTARATEWFTKAAEAGHGGAQLDLGAMGAQGIGQAPDLVEAYKWFWLATSAGVPGADASLREISQKLNGAQILDGVHRAAKFQDTHKSNAKAPAAAAR